MDVFIDFETRSEFDIKLGTHPYAAHPSTKVLCMAHAVDDEKVSLWLPGDDVPDWFDELRDPNTVLHAHNAQFERLIWHHQYTWPQPKLTQFHCTAAQAAAAGLPRALGKCAEALQIGVSKDLDGKVLVRKLCVPRKGTKSNKAQWNDDKGDMLSLYSYCCQDVEVERQIHRKLPPLPKREQHTYWLDQLINDRGFHVDLMLVGQILQLYGQHESALRRELARITDGHVKSGTQVARMLEWLSSRGCDLMDLRAGTVYQMHQELKRTENADPDVVRVLEIRLQLAKASNKKYAKYLAATSDDNRLRGAHLYFAAGTGRFAGRIVQTQNLPKGSLKSYELEPAIEMIPLGREAVDLIWGDVSGVLSSLIRPCITAGPGKKLIVCDFAAIEARALAWAAGEEDLVRQFHHYDSMTRQGNKCADVYETLAAKIFNVPVDMVTKPQRFVGKQARLGLGYGMGWAKFQATCLQYGQALDDELCQHVVTLYRELHPNIRNWWYDLERSALRTIHSGQQSRSRCVIWHKVGDWLMCHLPGKRNIPYFRARPEQKRNHRGGIVDEIQFYGIDPDTKQFRKESTYGARLSENIIQGICRDLLVDAMIRLERRGYQVVFHVHDEVVVEVPADDETAVDVVQSVLCETPDWAAGCPINAVGFETLRYRKED